MKKEDYVVFYEKDKPSTVWIYESKRKIGRLAGYWAQDEDSNKFTYHEVNGQPKLAPTLNKFIALHTPDKKRVKVFTRESFFVEML